MIRKRWPWPGSGWPSSPIGSRSSKQCTTSCPRCSPGSASPRCRASCLIWACPRCRSTNPSAVSRTRRTPRWTCGWDRQELTAAQVLNTYSKAELTRILRTYGEERFADRIAGRIVAEREREPFTHLRRLVRLLYDAVPAAARKSGGHPAKRTFQALRIEVNGELHALESVLPEAIAALARRRPDRRAGVPLARGPAGQADSRPRLPETGRRGTCRSCRLSCSRSCGC